jgi:Ca2+-binding EF-hand superfamily protein
MLLRYDANHDGTITRAEMEAGLKAEFDAADAKHTGCLDADETAAVNHARWAEDHSTASTIVDWNHDGCVDFNEFANAPRSLFDEIDRNGDGKLTPEEIRRFAGPMPKPADNTVKPASPPPTPGN